MTDIEGVEGAGPSTRKISVRAVFAVRDFRIIIGGAFASNIGSWMQQVTLGAFVYNLTKSPTFVSVVVFAQLGPMLILSLVGGMLADTLDRRRLMIWTQSEQMLASFALAAAALQPHPNRVAIVAAIFGVGVGQALSAPVWESLVPQLVPRELMAGAISLNSTQVNGARVLGPAVGGLLFATVGAGWVFAVNAFSYLFAIVAVWKVHLPRPVRHEVQSVWQRLGGGMVVARRDALVRRVLTTVATFSFFCIVVVNQMPTVADRNFGIASKSLAYGLLYAGFGLGAVTGAVSIGTFLSGVQPARLTRMALVAFGVVLAAYALLRTPVLAYPVAYLLGCSYFGTITAMNTTLQEHLDDRVRGRVMALWQMGFGGVIPLGVLAAGPIIEATSVRFVLLYGAVIAVALSWYFDLDRRRAA